MEEKIDSSKNSHVSFLSPLMAPDDETTPPDHHIHHTTPLHHHLLLPFTSSSSSSYPAFPYYDHNVAYNYDNTHFLPPLPELLSLETPTPPPPPPPPPSPPPLPPYGQKDDFTLGSIVANFRASRESRSNNNKHLQPLQRPQPNEPLCRARTRTRTRTRQSKISEKVYNLGKLLPGGHRHRNSTADMLEEAYKYIKFLKAQVSVLTSMPTHDINNNNNNNIIINSGNYNYDNNNNNSDIDGQSCALEKLARLSRQQLLQVVLNSPAAQVVMADNGWCLYSAEQVVVIQRAQARQKIIQQLLSSFPL